ncbi:MAG: hypothetical protein IJU44_07865, partial [Kiritimatiellae bacterium]|nr:hypothetical protein [Kiritimatiellia bacterium]
GGVQESLSYDADGNLAEINGMSLGWDARNRVCDIDYGYGWCGYDNTGRPVLSYVGDQTRKWLYDGWNIVRSVHDDGCATETSDYVWGADLSGTMDGAGGVGGLLAVRRGGVWHFPLYDANGNITAYISEAGAVSATYAYGPFGETIARTGMDFEHRFSTKPYNEELGTYTYIYREYSPVLGRWLSEDPVYDELEINFYSFVNNNPVCEYDYLGMTSVDQSKPNDNRVLVKFDFAVWMVRKRNRAFDPIINVLSTFYWGGYEAIEADFSINGFMNFDAPCANGKMLFQMVPKIWYPSEVGPPAGYHINVIRTPFYSLVGAPNNFTAENTTGVGVDELWGKGTHIGNDGTIMFPNAYPMYRYDNARFAIARKWKVTNGSEIKEDFYDDELFTRWGTMWHTPQGSPGNLWINVECGDVVEVQMGNDGVFEFKSKYNVKNYKSSGAF